MLSRKQATEARGIISDSALQLREKAEQLAALLSPAQLRQELAVLNRASNLSPLARATRAAIVRRLASPERDQ